MEMPVSLASRYAFSDADELLDIAATCRFLGGTGKPIHRTTLWRGVKAGIYPAPILISKRARRFILSELIGSRLKLNNHRTTECE